MFRADILCFKIRGCDGNVVYFCFTARNIPFEMSLTVRNLCLGQINNLKISMFNQKRIGLLIRWS